MKKAKQKANKKTKWLAFCVSNLLIIFFLFACLTNGGGGVDNSGLNELGPGSGSGGGGGGGDGDYDDDDDTSASSLANPHANWFNQFQPIIEEFGGDLECATPMECWQSMQNDEPVVLESEESWCTAGPICPYDPAGDPIPREPKTIQVTLNLCMTSQEALLIDTHGILKFIHYSSDNGKKSMHMSGGQLGEEPWLKFYEFYNVGCCPGNTLNNLIQVSRSDKDNIYEWKMPAVLKYDLGLDIDSTCSIVLENVAARGFNMNYDCALNMGYLPTWKISLGRSWNDIPDSRDRQYITGELSFTIKYMKKLEDINSY